MPFLRVFAERREPSLAYPQFCASLATKIASGQNIFGSYVLGLEKTTAVTTVAYVGTEVVVHGIFACTTKHVFPLQTGGSDKFEGIVC